MLEKLLAKLVPPVYAQCDPGSGSVNLGDCLTIGQSSPKALSSVYSRPADLVNVIATNLFLLAGLVLFLMVLFAGFKLTIDGGSKSKEEGKEAIKSIAIGFIVMFSAFWVVQIIELVTGAEILF